MSPHSRWMGSFIAMKFACSKLHEQGTTAANRDDFFGDENNAIILTLFLLAYNMPYHIWLVITSMQPNAMQIKY